MMKEQDSKAHWENVYNTKSPSEVSWTQEVPQTSLDFINSFNLPKDAAIIDVGGGDSNLVDFLLEDGFQDITVLDISEKALDRAKERLGERADQVTWIVSDVVAFGSDKTYDVWHDRAAFHFLTEPDQISRYLDTVKQTVRGYLTIGTFSENGPKKCSGLEIRQYSADSMTALFSEGFEKIKCLREYHVTPFDTKQHFQFCAFKSQHQH